MARASTWSVKGIDADTRALAREAAARRGVTIGAWLDRSIREQTGLPLDDPVPAPAAEAPVTGTFPPDAPAPGRAARRAGGLPPPAPSAARPPVTRYAVAGVLILVLIGGGYFVMDSLRTVPPDRETPAVAAASQPAAGPAPAPAPAQTASAAAPAPVAKITKPAAPGAATTTAAPAPARKEAVAPPEAQPDGPLARLAAAAQRNDPAAQYDLGLMYARGDQVPRNDKQAAQWFEAAASQGLAAAQYNLGVLYEQGRGVARNDVLAVFWYQSAAEQGHARAQHNLGTMLADGKGTPRNYGKAGEWFAKAAAAGIAESLYSLGMLHEHGLGRPRDLKAAIDFYQRARAAGSKQAESKLASLVVPPATVQPVQAPPPGARTRPRADALLDAKGIAELQGLLGKLDLSPGPADGLLGQQTVAAIRMYQQFAGLAVDGKPTYGLLLDLRQVVGAMSGGKPAR